MVKPNENGGVRQPVGHPANRPPAAGARLGAPRSRAAAVAQPQSAPPLAPMIELPARRRGRGWVVLLILVIAALGAGAWWYTNRAPIDDTSNASSKANVFASAISQAMTDNAASEQDHAHQKGAEIVADGQKALANAQTDRQRGQGHYWVAVGYFWQQQYDSALTSIHAAQLLVPDAADPLVCEGDIYINQNKPTEAMALADRAIVVDAKNASAHRLRAFALSNLKNKKDALTEIDKVIALDGTDTQAVTGDTAAKQAIQAGTLISVNAH